MATTAATMIAAAVAQARSDIEKHFEQEGAFDPGHAIGYEPTSDMHRNQFESLISHKIVREAAAGTYWFDRSAERREQERQKAAAWKALMFIAIILLSGTGIALLIWR